ncbi:response regulator [Fulvivirga sediminis]|uniref:Response regulator n=1 Tax=Fulvivirga sediminis TaxID=2803949 RepID=A0A937FDC2_9BACT|nr:response regulator [Fulvivirga sediminis]MBL3658338.1 response regulator [Fulvivirga sediminis]
MMDYNNILIIDDDDTSNYVASQAIKAHLKDIKITSVANGMEAIDYLKKNTNKMPKYVLLDINMPLMNGFEFLSWYDSSIFKGTTKIMMFTTSIRKKERDRAGKFSDVIAYIEKPLSRHIISEYMNFENLD